MYTHNKFPRVQHRIAKTGKFPRLVPETLPRFLVFPIIANCNDNYEDICFKMYDGYRFLSTLDYDFIIKLDENIHIRDTNLFLQIIQEEIKSHDYIALKQPPLVFRTGISKETALTDIGLSYFHLYNVSNKQISFLPTPFYKIPYAGTNLIFHYPQIFFDNNARKKFFSKEMPYAYLGEIIREFPQFEGKRILLLGPGYTPTYYNYPDNMVAFSWHSRNAFNIIIKELALDKVKGLYTALNKLNIEYVVCPEIQGTSDDFLDVHNSTQQCREFTEIVFIFNGVYFGKVKKL
jgi:hypothetical protein